MTNSTRSPSRAFSELRWLTYTSFSNSSERIYIAPVEIICTMPSWRGRSLPLRRYFFLPALLDSALGEQFRDNFTGAKTAFLGGAARGRSQVLEGKFVVWEFPEQVNNQRRAVECGRFLSYFFSLFIG